MTFFKASDVLLSEQTVVVGRWRDDPTGDGEGRYSVRWVRRGDGTRDAALSGELATKDELDQRLGGGWKFEPYDGMNEQMGGDYGYGQDLQKIEFVVITGGDPHRMTNEVELDPSALLDEIIDFGHRLASEYGGELVEDGTDNDPTVRQARPEEYDSSRHRLGHYEKRPYGTALYASFVLATDADPSQLLDDVIMFGEELAAEYDGEFDDQSATVGPAGMSEMGVRPMGISELNRIIMDEKRKALQEQEQGRKAKIMKDFEKSIQHAADYYSPGDSEGLRRIRDMFEREYSMPSRELRGAVWKLDTIVRDLIPSAAYDWIMR